MSAHPDDGLILRRAQVLAPAMDAQAIHAWIMDRPELYFGTIDAAVIAAANAIADAQWDKPAPDRLGRDSPAPSVNSPSIPRRHPLERESQ